MRKISRNGYRCGAMVRICNARDVLKVHEFLLRASARGFMTDAVPGERGWMVFGELHELRAALERADVNKRRHERGLVRCS